MSQIKNSRRTGVARALSKMGYCSRSLAQRLTTEGRIRVNGRPTRDPEMPVRVGSDQIEVDGHEIVGGRKIYLMLNKPRGIVTTAQDEKGRATIYSLLPADGAWVAPVGRLDKASEGLLLLTNDSEWGAQITSPESHVAKTYHVQVASLADDRLIAQLLAGVRDSGELLRAKSASILRRGGKNFWISIVLDEGKNRHIRRMFSALGLEVLRLVRVAIGHLQLGNLAKGSFRELTASERRSLMARKA
jgi:23S rRNA pseudouridine2605 synthase